MELDTSGFATQGPTVFAGNIGDNKYIIQVSPMGIRLLEGGKIVYQKWLKKVKQFIMTFLHFLVSVTIRE